MRPPIVRGDIPGSSLVYGPGGGRIRCAIACKATFLLTPGKLELAPAQEAIFESDSYWDDDTARSLSAATDLTPLKPKIDVLLVGHAFAPGGRSTRSVVTRLVVGSLDKSIEVVADRSAGEDGTILHGPKFTKMPLRYERAGGGPRTWNPVGLRHDARDPYGRTTLPNLLIPTRGEGPPAPTGYGPIAPRWPGRLEKLGRLAPTFRHDDWADSPLPDGFDLAYFNAAPPDQQLGELSPGDPVLLENLHRSEAVLSAAVPEVAPVVSVQRAGGGQPLGMRLDTLLFDTDRALLMITWRGEIDLARPDEALDVTIALLAAPTRPSATERDMFATHDTTDPPGTVAAPQVPAARPSTPRRDGALPFAAPPASLKTTSKLEPLQFGDARTPAAPPAPPPSQRERPTQQIPAVQLPQRPATAPPPTTASAEAHWAPPPPAPLPMPPSVDPPPWQGGIVAPPPRMTHDAAAVLAGVASASNAATANDPRSAGAVSSSLSASERRRPAVTEILDLVWFDKVAAPRIKQNPEWKRILDDLESTEFDPEAEDRPSSDDTGDDDDRREVFEVLTRGSPSGPERIDQALVDAVRNDGRFAPRLLLVSGELRFEFDDIEVLKATIAAAGPLAGEEGDLKQAVDRAGEFLKSPGLICSSDVARGFTQRIREAFERAPNRLVHAGYLNEQTERVLVDRRAYQRKNVFGERYLRGQTFFIGMDAGIPTYLPDDLTKKLPMFRTFRFRMLAETHHQEDQYEAHAAAFKPVALARVVR